MSVRDKKLILRVLAKLFATVAVVAVGYVLLQGLLNTRDADSDTTVLLQDVSDLHPGTIKYFDYKRRKILVWHKTQDQYLVVVAHDPVFGCPVEWRQGKFISICNGSEFGPDGKVYAGQATDENLKILNYEIQSNADLKIFIR